MKKLLLITLFTLSFLSCSKEDTCNIYQRTETKTEWWKLFQGIYRLDTYNNWGEQAGTTAVYFSDNCGDDGKISDESQVKTNTSASTYRIVFTRKICFKK